MSYILIDHSAGQDIDGKQGKKLELDAVACSHCGGVVAVLKRGCSTFHLSSIDVAVAAKKAPEASEHYVGKHTCSRCRKNICRRCALVMDRYHNGTCPGPFKARLEEAIAHRRNNEQFAYQYRSASR